MYRNALSHWAANGVFPSSMRDLGPPALESGAARWVYQSEVNRFSLVLGDYDRCGWVMMREFAWWYEPRTTPSADLGGEAIELLRLCVKHQLEQDEWPVDLTQLGLVLDWGDHGPWSLEPPRAASPLAPGLRGAIVGSHADSPFAVQFYWMPEWED
jgi:hypothetical protein